jgi:hypothetical protein
MKKNLITLMLMSLFVAPVMAGKPEWAGKGKPTAAQKSTHRSVMEAKEGFDSTDDRIKDKKNKSSKPKGLEKQASKKLKQSQKELDKGSERGISSRESNSKKWWKFWSE